MNPLHETRVLPWLNEFIVYKLGTQVIISLVLNSVEKIENEGENNATSWVFADTKPKER